MYKLLILSQNSKGVASSVAEFNTQERADKAFRNIIEANQILSDHGLGVVIIRLYVKI